MRFPLIYFEQTTGGNLAARQRHKPLQSFEEILDCFSQVCAGVAHLHSQQPPIIHRDIRPENVLVKRNEKSGELEYKLCDFGSSSCFSGYWQTSEEKRKIEDMIQV